MGAQHLLASVARPWEALRGEDHGFWLGLVPWEPRSGENAIEVSRDRQVGTGFFSLGVQRCRGGQLRGGRGGAGCEQGALEEVRRERRESRGSEWDQVEMLPRPATIPELASMRAAH